MYAVDNRCTPAIVVDQNNDPVPNSKVIEFNQDNWSDANNNNIIGELTATIEVDGTTYLRVRVISK